ncbi:CAZyme family GH28 [Penicillium roqueforti]|uniref:CAZyme family GH28 n=1 Tax=Penicillium roqueforti TaxID=5082 RepID=UPI0019094AF0|nr:CAZyme family GH28 [Penicillium roqueforti]KAF9250788.1 CAZyme family GH28 [Penicillium roqueforti]KAI1830854.1 CAZyme family GH28 [Penicillium roqueforti]KAI2707993.1 CAZyme family GH28 [Penicillium roqueforti]KAI2751365.1 CAZyme family GH28 [Penicillium roqueforti]KAI3115395.1 CAZyme family GH28 [Penicillium roqueforti]
MRFFGIPSLAMPLWLTVSPFVYANEERSSNVCIVKANGHQRDDVPNILEAFQRCGNGGTIIFPEDQAYWIGTRLNPVVSNIQIEWRGKWTFSDDLDYWRNHSYPVAFQNHAAGFIITGHNITIDGYGTGSIDGNGNTWYTAEKGDTQPGRPMPFVFWNVSDVSVENFYVKDPQLWAVNIMNGTNMRFNNIYCNATAVDAPYGENWVQNTDGFDTMDVQNVQLSNFVYQGGDDCVAIKPRSYNVDIHNVTCRGGNGIAIGSLGQYQEDSSVANIRIDTVKVIRYNDDMHNSAYIKTWVGALVPQSSYENAGLPRGGGWGSIRNVLFSNFEVHGANAGPTVKQDNGNNGSYSGTSLMSISNVAFVNFTGYIESTSTNVASVSCSNVHPCYNIDFDNVILYAQENATTPGIGSCKYTLEGGVHGLDGC